MEKLTQIPHQLTIDLYQPGMNMLSQAGLGGLAATLQSWTKAIEKGECERPENSDWQITDRSVTLIWGTEPGSARRFFSALYEFAFGIHEGLIDMPGTYEYGSRPKLEILAELQNAVSNTFLQFGPNRKKGGKDREVRCVHRGETSVVFTHQDLVEYTHQKAFKSLLNSSNDLGEECEIPGTIAPGFVQRHYVFPQAIITLPPSLTIAFHFAIVGTISFNLDNGTAVLVIPEVDDLIQFARRRYRINPLKLADCKIKTSGEAALETQIRIQVQDTFQAIETNSISVVEFRSLPWNKKQKNRSSVHHYKVGSNQFEFFKHILLMKEFRPRLATAKATMKNEEPNSFYSKSAVKSLLAENIASGRKWFSGFRSLYVSADGRPSEVRWKKLSYERKGLNKMAVDSEIQEYWANRAEVAFVQAIHTSIRRRRLAIRIEAGDDPMTTKNRINRQKQRWRIALATAKTHADFSRALSTIWSNIDHNEELQSNWKIILPLIRDAEQWTLIRDLALFALASYQPKSREQSVQSDTQATTKP